MDLLTNTHCISSPFRPPVLLPHSRYAISTSLCKKPIGKCTSMFAALNSDTTLKPTEITNKKEEDEEEEHVELRSWMDKNGFPPCKVALKERPSHDSKHRPIHYVAASEDLQQGDVAFSVPGSLVVTLERVLGNETVAELLTTNKLSELACLALYLMYEKKQGKSSFWYPYIRELDRQRGRGQLAVESPLLWSEAELDYLTGSPIKAEILERAEGIKREYNELDTVWFMAGSLFKQYPYDIPTEAFPFEIFKQAFVAVQSCVVHLQKVSLARRFALVPLGPPFLTYRSNSKAMLTSVNGAVQLVVDRSYKAGEPIVVWCGPQPNSKLLINYGFVDEDNSYDRMVVKASLNMEDPQYQEKRLAAQRNGKLSVQNFQVSVGKEKEAVMDMLPYLRLGYVSDPSDMQSVLSSQGPICPVSSCMERAVLDQLAEYFINRLAGYPTTLAEDEILLVDRNLNPKRRVATQLVRLEKKILKACLQATVDLINQLPDHSLAPCPAPYAPDLKWFWRLISYPPPTSFLSDLVENLALNCICVHTMPSFSIVSDCSKFCTRDCGYRVYLVCQFEIVVTCVVLLDPNGWWYKGKCEYPIPGMISMKIPTENKEPDLIVRRLNVPMLSNLKSLHCCTALISVVFGLWADY